MLNLRYFKLPQSPNSQGITLSTSQLLHRNKILTQIAIGPCNSSPEEVSFEIGIRP